MANAKTRMTIAKEEEERVEDDEGIEIEEDEEFNKEMENVMLEADRYMIRQQEHLMTERGDAQILRNVQGSPYLKL